MSEAKKAGISRAQWLRRLAQRRKDRTAFVLSGGGPYGALQVGMLKGLIEAGVKPDLVVGTSAGAMNAAFVAMDPTTDGIDRLESIWRSIKDDDLWPGSRNKRTWARLLMRGNRVFDNTGIASIISRELGEGVRFEDTRIPLSIVATEIGSGTEKVFTSGRLLEPLLASAAMPSIWPPVEIDGKTYMDGGVVNSVPVAPALAQGASKLYVVNCSARRQDSRPLVRPVDHLLHAFMISRTQRYEMERDEIAAKAELIDIPTPTLDFTVPFTSMGFTPQLITLGYESAKRFLSGYTAPEVPEESDEEAPAPS